MLNISEEKLQQTIINMLKEFYPDLVIILSLSGIKLQGSPIDIAKIINSMYKQGFRKGISDLNILLPEGISLYIELKKPGRKNGQSLEQKKFQQNLEFLKHNYFVSNSIDSFFIYINKYLTRAYKRSLYRTKLATHNINEDFLHLGKTNKETVSKFLKQQYNL